MHSMLQQRAKWTPSGGDRPCGEGIPRDLRRRLEALMRCDLSAVRLYIDPSLADLDVLAAAEGDRIFLSTQAPDPNTPAGVAVLGHELAHVMQQRQGRVHVPHDGSAVADDAVLEREADRTGLHCAAHLFPGSIADPGWPEALCGAPSQDAAGPAPVQFIVSAQESFADFVRLAYEKLKQVYDPSDLSPLARQTCESALRHICYQYRSDKVHQKLPLAGAAFCWTMNALLDVTRNNLVRDQGDSWHYLPTDPTDLAALKKYYTDRQAVFETSPWTLTWPTVPSVGRRKSEVEAGQARGTRSLASLSSTYLHVYPKRPGVLPTTWRMALNVCPEGMLRAVSAIVPMMDMYPCIDQMKFMAPRIVDKADSVIVYMNAGDSFPWAREQILELAGTLPLQPRVGAMMSEVVDGVGEGAEASGGALGGYGGSFTVFRCKAFYVAYKWMYKTLNGYSSRAFVDSLHWVMPCVGLDPANPQMLRPQGAWTQGPEADIVRQVYLGTGDFP